MLPPLSGLSPFSRPRFVAAGGGPVGTLFTYSFVDVHDPAYNTYLIGYTGGAASVYGSVTPFQGTEGSVRWGVPIGATTLSGTLSAGMFTLNDDGNFIIMEASSDDTTWYEISRVERTGGSDAYRNQPDPIPAGALGGTTLYIRGRLYAQSSQFWSQLFHPGMGHAFNLEVYHS